MRIDFHPEAIAELDHAAGWYLDRSPTAASRFARAVETALAKIAADPERFPFIGTQFRTCTVERFPYQVVFRMDSHRLYVIAVAHAKRRPGYWRDRS